MAADTVMKYIAKRKIVDILFEWIDKAEISRVSSMKYLVQNDNTK